MVTFRYVDIVINFKILYIDIFGFTSLQVAFQPEFLRAVSCEEDARAPWQIVFGCAKDADETRTRMSNCFLDL